MNLSPFPWRGCFNSELPQLWGASLHTGWVQLKDIAPHQLAVCIFFLSCPSWIMNDPRTLIPHLCWCLWSCVMWFFWCVCMYYVCMHVYCMICGITQYMCAVYVCVYTYTYVIAQGPENNIVMRTNHSLLIPLRRNLPLKLELGRQSASPLLLHLHSPKHCSFKYEHGHRQPLILVIGI